ncbi:hypothetical protein E7T06_09580 [Deinococcus sp. Arct2-2]|uniref:hypothetical protein n=1 Tax=Deinococcus sp. Arct2-2 TaxID=2568653 RepID=UPI0010A4C1F8|nr:hypothetical protein [Deinococcus sp. Arct2-2]THF69994.1 hypothetical protein E7T06_09580 [Deinococcus sp. Arct2-2]
MTQLQTVPTVSAPLDTHTRSLLLAAEAVLAHLHPRAPLRLAQVNFEGVAYASAPDPDALRLNRALAEEVVLVASAQAAARALLGLAPSRMGLVRDAGELLASGLTEPEEKEVLPAYLSVLEARARVLLRRSWAEVEVVAAGLRELGQLDARDVAHRIACAQSIRGTLLN